MATHHSTGSSCPRKIPDEKILNRYADSREKIDRDIDFIMVLTGVLSQYQVCTGDDGILVDLYAIGYLNRMLHDKALEIREEMDNLFPLAETIGAGEEEDSKPD